MPTVSVFFGIRISLYYRDHAPPHFHARYGEFDASISIDQLLVLRGRLPRRALAMVLEWAFIHRRALLDDWELARAELPLRPIPPLR